MRKPTESSGIDDMTAKCQHLNRAFHQIEEGDTFGDSDNELEAYAEAAISSDSDSTVADPDEDHMEEESENIHTPIVTVLKTKNSMVPSTILAQPQDFRKLFWTDQRAIPSQRTPNPT